MAQRKVPLTKSGKPDKRYAKSTRSKSKATGKSPSKRLQKRRARPIKPGYTANPISDYVVTVGNKKGEIGYLSDYSRTLSFDTEKSKALSFSKKAAETVAKMIQKIKPSGLAWVEAVKK